MKDYAHRITAGHAARHRPPKSKIGMGIALLDIAQDFILTCMFDEGLFDVLVFKGGTALRKMWAGSAGRFSTDLDFALRGSSLRRDDAGQLIANMLDNTDLGPFTVRSEERRHRWHLVLTSGLGDISVALKIDVGPPPWLTPEQKYPVPALIHRQYDFELPLIPTMRIEETLAEKISRLNRGSTARDAYDLVWVSKTPGLPIDRARLRRLAVLKIWADTHGLGGETVGRPSGPFNPAEWLEPRQEWDDEAIGLLCEPTPSLNDLDQELRSRYQWLQNLTAEERAWAQTRETDRSHVIRAILAHPDCGIDPAALW